MAKKIKKDETGSDGVDLNDAFEDDEGVEYGESKPRKKKKAGGLSGEELEKEIESIEKVNGRSAEIQEAEIKVSKPIQQVKKGDVIIIDNIKYMVDAHYVLIDHGTTKEMTLELYDDGDKDYQLRYFDDQMEKTLELYELQEILYVKKQFKKISW